MTSGRYGLVLREVGRLLGGGTVASLGAGQLLERFAVDRDGAAFEALVSRHGPMVLGTCRRMLSDPHDVDDAFQATILVLARKAGSIRDADRLGPWLHGVARRVATRSRALSARRRSRERPGVEEQTIEPPDALEGFEHRAAIDEELARLPEKYRAPLVLCYLEGLTHDEAAEQLRWPVGTVRSRLAGGRDRLRDRLARRGLAPTAAVPAILSHASIPQALLSATVRLASSAGSAPAHVANLAKGALVAMMWNKLKVVAVLGLMAGLTSGGAAALSLQGGDGQAIAKTEAAPKQEDDLAKLQGTWKLRMAQLDRVDDPTSTRALEGFWTVEGKVLVTTGRNMMSSRSELILGERGGVKTIDIVRVGGYGTGTTTRGLYRLEGNTLEICVSAPEGPRPAEFRPDDSDPFPVAISRFDKQPPKGPTKTEDEKQRGEAPAEARSRDTQGPKSARENQIESQRIAERWSTALSKEEDTKHRLNLAEITLNRFTTELNPPMDSARVEAEIDRINARVRKLEVEIAAKSEAIKAVVERAGARRVRFNTGDKSTVSTKDVEAPPVEEPVLATIPQPSTEPGTLEVPVVLGKGIGKANPRVAQPIVHTLQGNPTLFLVISPERDRLTMIDSESQKRSTFQMRGGATDIVPVSNNSQIALWTKGTGITRTAVFDRKSGRWFEQDLGEPATEIMPIMGGGMLGGPALISYTIKAPEVRRLIVFDGSNESWAAQDLPEPVRGGITGGPRVTSTTVTYRLAKTVRIYSSLAHKWSVLELKAAHPGTQVFGGPMSDNAGRMIFADGDIMHLYDPKTGDWTHIDTKDDK